MQSGDAGPPQERVRRALEHLGVDAASAPDVPPPVTARIGAALRAAPPPAAHAARPARPRRGRLRLVVAIVGLGAAAVAITLGTLAVLHSAPPPRTFPVGPTADRITVSARPSVGDTPKAVVTRP